MRHPILDAAEVIRQALKSVADANPSFMTTDDKAAALLEFARLDAQLDELRLRVLGDADDLAELTAERSPAGWLTRHTRVDHDEARADQSLANALTRRYPALATALREGEVTTAAARVIARCLDALPVEVPPDVLLAAEAALISHARDFTPRQLHRLGRRIVDVVAPEIAEEAEARSLARLEAAAHRRTRLGLRRLGDGTTRISGLLPDVVATRLATYLEAFTNPRKCPDQRPDPVVGAGDPVARLTYGRRLGEAFCQFLETLDVARLPMHGGDATTVVVTIDFESLRHDLGVGRLLGAAQVPGDPAGADTLTADDVRRLACNAQILPAVLDRAGEPLALGRAQRLFSPTQRKALLIRDGHCRAEGCDIPGTWSEAHHWIPWQRGGLTDLDNAVLLCNHHHQRVHDPAFSAERLCSGDVRFHRRR